MAIIGKLEKGKNLRKTLRDMKVGEIGFVTPWTLIFDENMTPYLNIGNDYSKHPGSTVELKIKRIGPEEDDFDVYINEVRKYEWTPRKNPLESIMGADPSDFVEIPFQKENYTHNLSNWEPEETSKNGLN